MATVTGYTAERMKIIEDTSVTDGEIRGDNLFLIPHNAPEIDAGSVRGPAGPVGPPGADGDISQATLDAAIAAEATARSTADQTEITARTNADNALSTNLSNTFSKYAKGIVQWDNTTASDQAIPASTDTTISGLTVSYTLVKDRWYRIAAIVHIAPSNGANLMIGIRENVTPGTNFAFARAGGTVFQVETLTAERILKVPTGYDRAVTFTVVAASTAAATVSNSSYPAQLYIEDLGMQY